MNKRKTETEDFIYGINPVMEALRAGRSMEALYVRTGRKGLDELKELAARAGVPVKAADAAFFEGRFPRGHQGVAARTTRPLYTPFDELLDISKKKMGTPFFVLLDGVEDPRNMGAILRTADATGVYGVIIEKRRSAGLSPAALKASAGAAEYVAVSAVPNIKNAIQEIREAFGALVVGLDSEGRSAPWEVDLTGPVAAVLGAEDKGLRKTVRERCDVLVGLPMLGRVGSLNVSVSAGAVFYEIMRQRLR